MIKKVIQFTRLMTYARHEVILFKSIMRFFIRFFIFFATCFILPLFYAFFIRFRKKALIIKSIIPILDSKEHVFNLLKSSFEDSKRAGEVIEINYEDSSSIKVHINLKRFKIDGLWDFTFTENDNILKITASVYIRSYLSAILMFLVGSKTLVDFYAYKIVSEKQVAIDVSIYNFFKRCLLVILSFNIIKKILNKMNNSFFKWLVRIKNSVKAFFQK